MNKSRLNVNLTKEVSKQLLDLQELLGEQKTQIVYRAMQELHDKYFKNKK